MRITLNKKAYAFAQQMIHDDNFDDKRGRADEKKAKPTSTMEDEFLKSHSWEEYGRWYLGAHHDRPENNKDRYQFPMGDFQKIHRSDLLAIQKDAHAQHFPDIAQAAQELVDRIDKKSS